MEVKLKGLEYGEMLKRFGFTGLELRRKVFLHRSELITFLLCLEITNIAIKCKLNMNKIFVISIKFYISKKYLF